MTDDETPEDVAKQCLAYMRDDEFGPSVTLVHLEGEPESYCYVGLTSRRGGDLALQGPDGASYLSALRLLLNQLRTRASLPEGL